MIKALYEEVVDFEEYHYRAKDTITFGGMNENLGAFGPMLNRNIRYKIAEDITLKGKWTEQKSPYGFEYAWEAYIFTPEALRELLAATYRNGMRRVPSPSALAKGFDETTFPDHNYPDKENPAKAKP